MALPESTKELIDALVQWRESDRIITQRLAAREQALKDSRGPPARDWLAPTYININRSAWDL